jgi:hypothetical protein
MDTYERLQPGDLAQAAVVEAIFVYNTAMRDQMLPRKPLPHPEVEERRLAPIKDLMPGAEVITRDTERSALAVAGVGRVQCPRPRVETDGGQPARRPKWTHTRHAWSRFGKQCRIVPGVFTPVLAKHTKRFNLIDTLAVGVDRIQRSFEPMRRQVEEWRQAQITDERAKLILYAAFVDGKLEAPRTLLPQVHRLYFQPEYEEFSPRTMWSLSNAFTSAFKELDPIPQFKATAKLGAFLSQLPG